MPVINNAVVLIPKLSVVIGDTVQTITRTYKEPEGNPYQEATSYEDYVDKTSRLSVTISEEARALQQRDIDISKYDWKARLLEAATSSNHHVVTQNTQTIQEYLVERYGDLPMNVYATKINKSNQNLESTYTELSQVFNDIMMDLHEKDSSLKYADFGFSVNADKKIILTYANDLTYQQSQQIKKALNSSSKLVNLANQWADEQINHVKIKEEDRYIRFDRENYAQTIDIGAALRPSYIKATYKYDYDHPNLLKPIVKPPAIDSNNGWNEQLFRNAERITVS